AIAAWRSRVAPKFIWAEIQARRVEEGIELRHIRDAEQPAEQLRLLSADELQAWSQTDALGAYRPNKTAPGLQPGWRLVAREDLELEFALEAAYPGAVADWFSVVSGSARPTSFREFTGRQTGMYRGVRRLDDAQARSVARSGCDAAFCLRCRLWEVPGLAAESESGKSAIPCLEPCALLLEFSRQAVRGLDGGAWPVFLDAADSESAIAALDHALHQRDPGLREGDFASPLNPRRLLRLRQQIAEVTSGSGKSSEEG
ncbi:MAG: hypothetical protein KIT22_16985, partial [Verrucomicrobiae bacterium]|nr:hypothetical protein [Verrucomicrobiae bacterium]